uniref:Uncharacterized protein n=1 Tax=Arundo donax TaxID=35708 RepID=A0A0A9D021_ARUDO
MGSAENLNSKSIIMHPVDSSEIFLHAVIGLILLTTKDIHPSYFSSMRRNNPKAHLSISFSSKGVRMVILRIRTNIIFALCITLYSWCSTN